MQSDWAKQSLYKRLAGTAVVQFKKLQCKSVEVEVEMTRSRPGSLWRSKKRVRM
ncbi:hypothetical protein FOFC_17304 [Fusarium oxysporum]|nr:hypothetical protein FOFC_17304 [Fusarium oxysporum]